MSSAVAEFGGIGIVVNVAGVQRSAPIDSYNDNDSDWDLMMNVNPKSCYLPAKRSVKTLRRRGGAVVNVFSLAALNGGADQSRLRRVQGCDQFVHQVLSSELARDNIRVNALCPGWVNTSFNKPAIDVMVGAEQQALLIE